MTYSQAFFYFCLSFIAGIFLGSLFYFSQPLMLGFLVLGIFLISVPPFSKRTGIVAVGFCILFLIAGIWRHNQSESKIYYPEEQTISFTGTISKEPDIRENNIKLTIEARELPGKVLVTARRYPEYQYGDKLKISGELQTPREFEDFNYKGYLAKDGIYSVMYWPKIELAAKNQGNFIYAEILDFKNGLRRSVYQNLSPPQSLVLGAMILGDKSQISADWKNKLNIVGLRHITCISGMHVGILTIILMTLLIGLGFWRHHAFYLTVFLIIFFIFMTGLQPSAVRAGIMGGLVLLAQYFGRFNQSFRALIFAAAAMLVFNPLLLRADVGFQLSFLAMLGIIELESVFRNRLFSPIPKNVREFAYYFHKFRYYFFSAISLKNPQLQNVAAMTLAAQVFTLPLLIYNFGYISLAAPLTNVLIVPLLPYILGFGFLFGLVGMVLPFLGWVFSLPCWLLLTYVIKIVDWFSSFPYSSLVLKISWFWLAVSYLILGYFVWRLRQKQRFKFLDY